MIPTVPPLASTGSNIEEDAEMTTKIETTTTPETTTSMSIPVTTSLKSNTGAKFAFVQAKNTPDEHENHKHVEHEYVLNTDYEYDEYKDDDEVASESKTKTKHDTEQPCGGILSEPFGRISSGKFPLPYENDCDCEWLIQAPKGTTITINFLKFSLEKSEKCRHDFLAVYDGASKAFPMMGKKYCGSSLPTNLHSKGNRLLISFKSDSSVRHPGFQLFY